MLARETYKKTLQIHYLALYLQFAVRYQDICSHIDAHICVLYIYSIGIRPTKELQTAYNERNVECPTVGAARNCI